MSQDNAVAVPAIRPDDLARAVRNIRRSADNGNTRGFMLAFVDDRNFGFNFFVRGGSDVSAALYLVQDHERLPPEYLCAFQGGADSIDSFAERFLRISAGRMRVDYGRLVTFFSSRESESEWRFQPWEHSGPGHTQDNYLYWRTHLWPVVLRIVNTPPQCVKDMPPAVRTAILQQLRGHAAERMIVLER